jgi:excisionase family DNA binding protein
MGRRSVNLEDVGLPVEQSLISSVAAARYWGVSRQMVSKLVKNGQVPARRIGGSVLIPRNVVLDIGENGLPSGSYKAVAVPDGRAFKEHLARAFGDLPPARKLPPGRVGQRDFVAAILSISGGTNLADRSGPVGLVRAS